LMFEMKGNHDSYCNNGHVDGKPQPRKEC
jgi:hypothetical protein